MFAVARGVIGFGIPMAIVSASSLIGELAYPKERPYLGSLFNASWFVGAIIAAGVTFGTFAMSNNWSWRIPSVLVSFAPCHVQLHTNRGLASGAFPHANHFYVLASRESSMVDFEGS